MSLLKLALLLSSLTLILAANTPTRADYSLTPSITNKAQTLEMIIRKGEIIGARQVERGYFTLGGNQWVFILPEGFRQESSSPGKITLVNQEYDCFLTFGPADPHVDQGGLLSTDDCRRRLLERFSNSVVIHQSSLTVATNFGPAFDLEWIGAGGTSQRMRAGFVSSPSGMLELTMLTTSANFARRECCFNLFTLSFRSNHEAPPQSAAIPDNS